MRMQFKKIKLHNFMSFEDAEIILDTPGFTVVSGENNNIEDNSSSNGSGKSAIFEAIVFALTGETQRKCTGSQVLRLGKKEGFVELTLLSNNDEFVIKRGF